MHLFIPGHTLVHHLRRSGIVVCPGFATSFQEIGEALIVCEHLLFDRNQNEYAIIFGQGIFNGMENMVQIIQLIQYGVRHVMAPFQWESLPLSARLM